MKMIKCFFVLVATLSVFAIFGCTKDEPLPVDTDKPIYINDLIAEISAIEKMQDPALKLGRIAELWDTLRICGRIPWISNDTIVFVCKSNAATVHIVGDMTGWSFKNDYQCTKLGPSDVWYLVKTFPKDARLDYKIVENKSNWKLDPENPKKQLSGFGYNSAFSMPDYDSSKYIVSVQGVNKGMLSTAHIIASNKLSRNVRFWVYTPYDYTNLDSLPAIYVLDGQDYKTDGMGCMINVLDNVMAENLIIPVIAVFIDPINPVTGNNQREELFLNNALYAGFFKEELVPFIDSTYKTAHNPAKRAILGTSYGGNCAAYFGYKIPDVFKLLAPQSPAFNSNVLSLYNQSTSLPIDKVFITTGVFYDTEVDANQLEQILKSKQVQYQYIKVNEGHSWGNWSALLDDILIGFFGK
jgi:enterochelin esterase-like enzyme